MVELLGTNRRPVNDEVIIISILVNHVLADVSIMFPIWVTVTRPFLGKIQKKKYFWWMNLFYIPSFPMCKGFQPGAGKQPHLSSPK